MGNDPFLNRLRWLTLAAIMVLIIWQLLPWIERYWIGLTAEPRPVTARGELAADEQATHVIEKTADATIRLNNGRSYQAVLIGSSPEHDLAVLRISVAFDPPPTGDQRCRFADPIGRRSGESSDLALGQGADGADVFTNRELNNHQAKSLWVKEKC